ncbi:MAG: tyrosine-type recombinase/integrase, partial [Chloroflexota bacterium]
MTTRNSVWRWNDMRDQRRNRKVPLEQFMEGWLLWGNYAPRTVQWYREVFLHFVKWVRASGQEGVLGDLDPQLARRWQLSLQQAGRSVNTVRGYLATFKSFARYLADEGITRDGHQQALNLLDGVKVPKLPRSRPVTYRDAEIEAILDGINPKHQYGARNLALIRVMLDGGLRLNETVGLLLEDVDWTTGRLHVRWQTAKRQKERDTFVGKRTLL